MGVDLYKAKREGGGRLHALANPARFRRIAQACLPWLLGFGLLLTAAGLVIGLFFSPPDYLQGEAVRILYVHVPSAWLGLQGYAAMAIAAACGFIWRHPLSELAVEAIAPIGALFTGLCLVTGSLWGRPTWGTFWVWDGRLTSMLVLFLLYLGVIALIHAFDDRRRGLAAGGILAILGTINLPVIKFSVEWWNTLHQPASIRLSGSTIDGSMLVPLLLSALGFQLLFIAILLMRMRLLIARQRVEMRRRRRALDIG